MFVVGIDGCRDGWVSFKVDLESLSTSEKGQDRESKELFSGCAADNHRFDGIR